MHRWCTPNAITANEPSFWKPYTSLMPPAGSTLDAARLRVFREVVRRGSLSAAAEALSFTQPAVSRQIAALEREAGAQLLERTPRGIRLTEPGRVLLGHAEAILDRMATARAQVEAVASLTGGRLRIGSFPTANATIVPRAIAAFARRAPGGRALARRGDHAATRSRACAPATIDLAVVTHGPELESADVEVVDLVDDELLVALPAAHPLAHKPKPAPARPARRDVDRERRAPARSRRCSTRRVRRASSRAWLRRRAVARRSRASSRRASASRSSPVSAIATVRDDIVLRSLSPHAPRRRIVAALSAGYRAPGRRAIRRAAARGGGRPRRLRRAGDGDSGPAREAGTPA